MAGTADLRAQVVKDVLTHHEQQLFLRAKAGKSADTLAQLYRQYEGPNGVREKLNQLEIRVAAEVRDRQRRANGNGVADLVGDPVEDELGGVPVKVKAAAPFPPESMSPPVRTHTAERSRTAPIREAPAEHPPPPLPPRKRGDCAEKILELLAAGSQTVSELSPQAGFSKAAVFMAIKKLAAEGRIVDTGRVRKLAPRFRGGIVWALPSQMPYPIVDMPTVVKPSTEDVAARSDAQDVPAPGSLDALLANANTETLRVMLDRCAWETRRLEHALARSY